MPLEQPYFEKGAKNAFTIAGRRTIQFLSHHHLHLREMANFATAPFLDHDSSRDIRSLKNRVEKRLSTNDPADKVLAENFLFLPHEVVLRASEFHMDGWLRDQLVGCLALNDEVIEYELLRNHVKHRDENFHIPTTRLFGGKLLGERRWYFENETNSLALIWRAKIAQMGKPLLNPEITDHDRFFWQGVLDKMRSHVIDGLFYTAKGSEKSWFDAFKFPTVDVVTYNQGIYATALLAAKTLGLDVSDEETQKAIDGYNSLLHPTGRLQLSKNVPYKDVSSLFGEFLSEWLFDKKLLKPETIKKTYESFSKLDEQSFMVVSKDDDSCLDPSEFNESYGPLVYQNGTEWPLFSAAARYVYERATLNHDPEFWKQKIKALILTKNAESYVPGEKFTYDSSRVEHLWNAAVYAIAKKVMSRDNYINAIKPFKTNIISEASQMQDSSL